MDIEVHEIEKVEIAHYPSAGCVDLEVTVTGGNKICLISLYAKTPEDFADLAARLPE